MQKFNGLSFPTVEEASFVSLSQFITALLISKCFFFLVLLDLVVTFAWYFH